MPGRQAPCWATQVAASTWESLDRDVVILGVNGNAFDIRETLDLLNRHGMIRGRCAGFLDDDPAKAGASFHGLPVLGVLEDARNLKDALFVNAIGNERTFRLKRFLLERTGLEPERFATVVHPTAFVSDTAVLGRGTVLLQHVTVAAEAVLGDHVMVLPGSIVSHNATVGDCCCLAGGVRISGFVQVLENCYLGTGCCLRDGITIGPGSLAGMGSVVVKSVEPGIVVAGNPAKFLKHLD